MKRRKVDDMMVSRFITASGCYSEEPVAQIRASVANGLEAALNPPAEPEIEVTPAMIDAAYDAVCATGKMWKEMNATFIAPIIYRAMERARMAGSETKPFTTDSLSRLERFQHRRHADPTNMPPHFHVRDGRVPRVAPYMTLRGADYWCHMRGPGDFGARNHRRRDDPT